LLKPKNDEHVNDLLSLLQMMSPEMIAIAN